MVVKPLAALLLAVASSGMLAQGSALPQAQTETVEAAISGHVQALEQSAQRPIDDLITEFENERFAPDFKNSTTEDQRRSLLTAIRNAAASAGGVMVQPAPGGVEIMLMGPVEHRIAMTLEETAPFRIASLSIEEVAPPLPITRANLESRIDEYMEGRSGLVHVRLGGEEVLSKGYGTGNAALGTTIDSDTVFGIGSRPIDFTTAAVMLLEKQGKLSFDDTLADHFDNVPTDRAGMTIRQMMTGKSGLPDFPANDSDADADLTWITREQFIARTMATPLLFATGEGDAHSHWAFGVLAAIVEKRSGQPYAKFLRENFFDPAGMERTGDYGESRGLPLEAFAVGGGKQVGLPNIPPNWGPTSWLVLGSGGMFSTLNDLRSFYDYLATSDVLGPKNQSHFNSEQAQVDGSERGFELISLIGEGRRNEAWILLNSGGGTATRDSVIRPLMALIRSE